jgi:sigma-B regulation protein RsbU (phosphoserine phosphatase)
VSSGSQYNAEFRVVWPDGTTHWLLTRARAFSDESGEPVRLIGVSMDITETVELRHKVESQLSMLESALTPAKLSVQSGYRTAAVYLPARPGEEICGDLYDVFTTENGKIAVMIGDVSGKGIEAASLAAAARSTIRSFAYDLSSPGNALTHANAVLQSEASDLERFTTAFLAIIDPTTGQLHYAIAGHPPAAVWRVNGTIDFLEGIGPPVGPITGYQYAEFTGELGPGEKIVLYTDGVLEARRGEVFFELEGIIRTLAEYGQGTPDEIASGLLTAARDWAEGSLRDDVAIVVVERPPE